MESRSKRTAKVHVDNAIVSRPEAAVAEAAAIETTHSANKHRHPPVSAAGLALRKRATNLSHDISTEQLFSDELIDAKVADEDEDEEEEDKVAVVQKEINADSAGKTMYRIESHSALSSLEAAHLTADSLPTSPSSSPPRKGGKPHKLMPLPAVTSNERMVSLPSSPRSTVVCDKCRMPKDMPPMHAAAYAGHLQCLETLLDQDDVVLSSPGATTPRELDKKQRTPLFYSCAANRIDCCALLLSRRHSWRDMADKQLDTPVHVCCFFGWYECLQKLLVAGADPHGRNAKGFKPSHIAKTKECLECLLSYGDDLLQGDKLGRTPLFVACARDRALCVEFLCIWNHQTRSWMLEQEDQRGDRPIHAAACNGSLASLESLLTYGADPVAANSKGFTPKDLALANKHTPCVERLARAEEELANSAGTTWFAPANAVNTESTDPGGASGTDNDGQNPAPSSTDWIECWDNDSGQAFFYHNLTGKCQWEVPMGVTPHLAARVAQQQQQSNNEDDDSGEYVWVKKKKHTVCVVTSKDTEWTAVQDPMSKAIYYKNARTGQSQWEEPDAVQELQNASSAHASQEATRIWEQLEDSRRALAAALAREKHRQMATHEQALLQYKQHLRERREEIQKREEQARLQQLLPRSSFIRRKKQSMMLKVVSHGSGSNNVITHEPQDEKLEAICASEPALDLFLSTYLRLQGVRELQVLTGEKRFCNCVYHYYVALVDPVNMAAGLSKSQFRTLLRDALIIPSFAGPVKAPGSAPLKLHLVDLIYAQALRNESPELVAHSSHGSLVGHHRPGGAGVPTGVSAGNDAAQSQHLGLLGFTTAMQLVRERVVTQAEEQGSEDIEDDEEWFLLTYLLPLVRQLGAKLVSHIRECKEWDLAIQACSETQTLLTTKRSLIQSLHRHYSSQEPKVKMLSFRGLSQFVQDFALVPVTSLSALHQFYEAVNWINGNAHTAIISFEKFQQLLALLALCPGLPDGPTRLTLLTSTRQQQQNQTSVQANATTDQPKGLVAPLKQFFQTLEHSPAMHVLRTPTNG